MSHASVLYGPESLAYEVFAAQAPTPGPGFEGCNISQRGRYPLGTQLVLIDGKKFRFALNGGATGVVGDVASGAAIVSTDVDLTPTTPSTTVNFVGGKTISFTHGAGTAVINYFAEGYAVMSLAPSGGSTYKIAAHAALTSGGTGEIVFLAPGHVLRDTAITTTTDIDLIAHPYASTIQIAATISSMPVGVYVTAPTAGQFMWLATRGTTGTLCAGTMTIGSPAVCLLSGGTAGAVAPASAATQPVVGTVQRVAATGEWSTIFVTIDG